MKQLPSPTPLSPTPLSRCVVGIVQMLPHLSAGTNLHKRRTAKRSDDLWLSCPRPCPCYSPTHCPCPCPCPHLWPLSLSLAGTTPHLAPLSAPNLTIQKFLVEISCEMPPAEAEAEAAAAAAQLQSSSSSEGDGNDIEMKQSRETMGTLQVM